MILCRRLTFLWAHRCDGPNSSKRCIIRLLESFGWNVYISVFLMSYKALFDALHLACLHVGFQIPLVLRNFQIFGWQLFALIFGHWPLLLDSCRFLRFLGGSVRNLVIIDDSIGDLGRGCESKDWWIVFERFLGNWHLSRSTTLLCWAIRFLFNIQRLESIFLNNCFKPNRIALFHSFTWELLLAIFQKCLALHGILLSVFSWPSPLLYHIDLFRGRFLLWHLIIEIEEAESSWFLDLWLTSLGFLWINLIHLILDDLAKWSLGLALHLLGCFAWLLRCFLRSVLRLISQGRFGVGDLLQRNWFFLRNLNWFFLGFGFGSWESRLLFVSLCGRFDSHASWLGACFPWWESRQVFCLFSIRFCRCGVFNSDICFLSLFFALLLVYFYRFSHDDVLFLIFSLWSWFQICRGLRNCFFKS